jgi:hypothetical protein
MNTHQENMTAAQAVGYIAGAGLSFVQRHYRAFAILMAFGGLALILIDARLTIAAASFSLRFGEFAQLGIVMLVMSGGLWLLLRPWEKR